ncbi:late competence protein ComER [Anoxybacillus rupiensis]|uniref:Pyrroline-5-carboxylate reductase n=1 Tax=Anoxybacteroides rupiense TaxID=311460 RepID=A0ABD5IRJ9_9BACL|nr:MULTISPECIES: late competence protein ComER [Anoxybacillus]KXG11349.1 Pyrroline-5-carboxylate reductase [Anoxybacillus sp. P3H1B]MBB3906927.1 competence protein ComER [Anoxybacillus rupiensis]MBS2769963.1 late competence protein ComER [Anoxybacillus rupiensis]MDE8562665.1 late competence protein ComER [Anoxybacillus rupiensis]MED5050910.1 late competence protein ComER [Anoxybacillus rupiensis]
MKIGVIGTGNMGRILIEAFLEAKAVNPNELILTNRTLQKALDIQKEHAEVEVAASPEDVIRRATVILLCVKPLDIHPLLKQLSPYWTKDHCLISITSPITVQQLESIVPCHVVRVIPSITNRALSGASLITFGHRCSSHYQTYIKELFQKISTPCVIEQDITRIASDLASCGPAFFSYLLQRFIHAAVEKTNISREMATILTSEMIIGLGELLKKNVYTLPTLQEKVHVKGGITGEGLSVLEAELGELFEHVFERTHAKFNQEIEKIKQQFQN